MLIGMMALLMGALSVGCGAAVGEGEDEAGLEEVGEAEQAVLDYCGKQCIAEYRHCVLNGGGYEGCRGERDACIAECPPICELGDPYCP
jgi:hypothetical protein